MECHCHCHICGQKPCDYDSCIHCKPETDVRLSDSKPDKPHEDVRPETNGSEEMTVGDVLQWQKKHEQLTSEGAKIVHIKQLLQKNTQEVIEKAKSDIFEFIEGSYDPELKTYDYEGIGEAVLSYYLGDFEKKMESLKS
jgi:hypothetical protein